jgi:hypothetical protein
MVREGTLIFRSNYGLIGFGNTWNCLPECIVTKGSFNTPKKAALAGIENQNLKVYTKGQTSAFWNTNLNSLQWFRYSKYLTKIQNER